MTEIILVGRSRDEIDDKADLLLEAFLGALEEFSTEELEDIKARRHEIYAGGWMERMLNEYIEVWR